MYENIGEKIKVLAKVICWIGIIASIAFGIIMITTDERTVFDGIAVVIFGPLFSWISSFTLYGFGQLVENSDKLVLQNSKHDDNVRNESSNQFAKGAKAYKSNKVSPDFVTEIENTPKEDLLLILRDQKDLYSKDEIVFIENALKSM